MLGSTRLAEVVAAVCRLGRVGYRANWREPLFGSLVVLTLAFAVGANASVFWIVSAIWLQPRPVAEPDRVVVVTVVRDSGRITDALSEQDLERLLASQAFEAVAGQVVNVGPYQDISPRLRLAGIDHPVEVLGVSANYFDVLGLTIFGRDFSNADDERGAAPVAIISDHLWRSEFRSSDDVIGLTIDAQPEAVTVVGIAPPGFRGARLGERVDIWVPWAVAGRLSSMASVPGVREGGRIGAVAAVARLRPDFSVHATAAQLGSAPQGEYELLPISSAVGLPGRVTTPLGEQNALALLIAMSAVVLVAGIATLVALMLAHLERRRRDLETHVALGSGRRGVVVAVLTTVLWPLVVGALAAVVAATTILAAAKTLTLPIGLSLSRAGIEPDWRLVGLCVAGSIGLVLLSLGVASLLFFRLVRRGSSRNAIRTAIPLLGLRRNLLAFHVATTVVLLIGALIFTRSISFGFGEGAGFDVRRTVFVSIQPSIAEFYDATSGDGFSESERERQEVAELMVRLRSVPGVEHLAVGESPVRKGDLGSLAVGMAVAQPVVVAASEGRLEATLGVHRGGPGYLSALGLPTRLGGPPAAGTVGVFVTRSAAERFWPNETPIGQYVGMRRGGYRITGVVPDFVQGSIAEGRIGGVVLESSAIGPHSAGATGLNLVLHTARDAARVVPFIEEACRQAFPMARVLRVSSGTELVAADLGQERLGGAFFVCFGIVLLVLGVASTFGLVAYVADSQARDFCIRLALGAEPRSIRLSAVRAGLLPVAIGAVEGVVLAALLSGSVSAMVHGVSVVDPVSYVGAVVLAVGPAVCAGTAAAVRLRRLSAMQLLRVE